MGQRLNIEIIQNGETLANAYYHWSAYTSSSLQLTQLIMEKIEKIQHEDKVIRAVRLLEITGALLTEEEVEIMKKRNKEEAFETATSRNEGLIAISKKGIESTRDWEEGRVEINFDDNTVNFSVSYEYEKEVYLEDYEESEEDYNELPVKAFDYDFSNIPFEKFNEFANALLEVIENRKYAIRLENGNVISFVE